VGFLRRIWREPGRRAMAILIVLGALVGGAIAIV
jgi:hypothetical protein